MFDHICTPAKDPHIGLARILSDGLGMTVDPGKLRAVLVLHWPKVSALAHQIHNEAERDRAAPKPAVEYGAYGDMSCGAPEPK